MAGSDTDGNAQKHRPLPSVNVALLPHERRAQRMRYITVATLAALGLLLGVAAAFGREMLAALQHEGPPPDDSPWPSERAGAPAPDVLASTVTTRREADLEHTRPALARQEEAPAAATASDELAAEAPSGEPGTVVREFGQARGFRDALVQAGASDVEADALVKALQKLLDFRRCRPEHQLAFTRDGSGQLADFEYRASLTDVYRATRDGDGSYKAVKVEVPIDERRIAKGGFIADSLGRALDGLSLGRSLASVFVEAFENVIDFKKHSREGDSFRLVVEEQYIGEKFLGYDDVLALQYEGERVGKHQAFWFESGKGRGDFYDESGRALHGGWLRTPLRYDHISSGYNLRRRHPILKRIVPHHGIDYAASPGTTVWAAADGVVSFAGYRGANGNLIALKHPGGYETFYAHLSRIARGIKSGAKVSQRQPIGAVGSTGRSTGPHLHFGLKRHGRFIDPLRQLNGPGKPLPAGLMNRFRNHVQGLKRELAAIALAAAPAPSGEPEQAEPVDADGEVFHDEGPLDL